MGVPRRRRGGIKHRLPSSTVPTMPWETASMTPTPEQGDGSRLGAKPKTRPTPTPNTKTKKREESPPPTYKPDEYVLERWGKKKIDVGKKHLGDTFEHVRLNDQSYCQWVLRNTGGKKVYSETLMNFANYLEVHRRLEKEAKKGASTSEDDNEATKTKESESDSETDKDLL